MSNKIAVWCKESFNREWLEFLSLRNIFDYNKSNLYNAGLLRFF